MIILLHWYIYKDLYIYYRHIHTHIHIYSNYLITPVTVFPFAPLHPVSPMPSGNSPFRSCPWVMHISSLATPFPILFLTYHCLL